VGWSGVHLKIVPTGCRPFRRSRHSIVPLWRRVAGRKARDEAAACGAQAFGSRSREATCVRKIPATVCLLPKRLVSPIRFVSFRPQIDPRPPCAQAHEIRKVSRGRGASCGTPRSARQHALRRDRGAGHQVHRRCSRAVAESTVKSAAEGRPAGTGVGKELHPGLICRWSGPATHSPAYSGSALGRQVATARRRRDSATK